jgi:hypothetical protein
MVLTDNIKQLEKAAHSAERGAEINYDLAQRAQAKVDSGQPEFLNAYHHFDETSRRCSQEARELGEHIRKLKK